MVQWLGLHVSTSGGTGSIPGWGTKVPHATLRGQKEVVGAAKEEKGAGRPRERMHRGKAQQ